MIRRARQHKQEIGQPIDVSQQHGIRRRRQPAERGNPNRLTRLDTILDIRPKNPVGRAPGRALA